MKVGIVIIFNIFTANKIANMLYAMIIYVALKGISTTYSQQLASLALSKQRACDCEGRDSGQENESMVLGHE
jgi:cell division protein FtsL